jgi:hypothetical protein
MRRIDAEKESVLIRPIGGIRVQKVTVAVFRNWPRMDTDDAD